MASYVLFKSDSILLNIVQYFCDDKMLEAEWYFTLNVTSIPKLSETPKPAQV